MLPPNWTRDKVARKYRAANSKSLWLMTWNSTHPSFQLTFNKARTWQNQLEKREAEENDANDFIDE